MNYLYILRVYEQSKTPGDVVYNTYGVTCTEMELDVLTGQSLINRVDILYDCGERWVILYMYIEQLGRKVVGNSGKPSNCIVMLMG